MLYERNIYLDEKVLEGSRDFNLEMNSFAKSDLEKICCCFVTVEEFLFRSSIASLSNKTFCDFFTYCSCLNNCFK